MNWATVIIAGAALFYAALALNIQDAEYNDDDISMSRELAVAREADAACRKNLEATGIRMKTEAIQIICDEHHKALRRWWRAMEERPSWLERHGLKNPLWQLGIFLTAIVLLPFILAAVALPFRAIGWLTSKPIDTPRGPDLQDLKTTQPLKGDAKPETNQASTTQIRLATPLPTTPEVSRVSETKEKQTRALMDYERDATRIADLFRGLAPDTSDLCAAVTKVEIIDSWNGLSNIGPITKVHRLERVQGQYLGESTFRIGFTNLENKPDALSASAPLVLYEDRAPRFVEALGECPITIGEYTPYKMHTDDFPHISISLIVGTVLLKIWTESQRRSKAIGHAPWQAEIDGIKWTVSTAGPWRALMIIAPRLNKEVYDWLRAKVAPLVKSLDIVQ